MWRTPLRRKQEKFAAVRKVDFVGLRTKALADMVGLFRDVLGVLIVRQSGDLVGFKLADRTTLELCGPHEDFHAFFETGPVVAFKVDDGGD
jgi:hypothetical protein